MGIAASIVESARIPKFASSRAAARLAAAARLLYRPLAPSSERRSEEQRARPAGAWSPSNAPYSFRSGRARERHATPLRGAASVVLSPQHGASPAGGRRCGRRPALTRYLVHRGCVSAALVALATA